MSSAQKMTRAMVVHAVGGPEALSWQEWPVGDPGPGEVRLRQTVIGLNFIDIYQRSGLYPVGEGPFIPGNEAAGVVTALGAGVRGLAPGDRVCYQGQLGAYAEERLIAADRLVPIPEGIDERTAAAVLLKGLTAYYLLFKTWPVRAGETVLWHAAAGGTGMIATQWAKSLGATVIGTVGGERKSAIAKAHGCDHVIDYSAGDFAPAVRELTAGRGVDVVYDGVGQATFAGSLECLRPRGLMVSFGNASGVVAIPDLTVLSRRGSLYLTRPTGLHYLAERQDFLAGAKALFDAILAGTIRVEIGQSFALSAAAEAHRALEDRRTTGSVLLLP